MSRREPGRREPGRREPGRRGRWVSPALWAGLAAATAGLALSLAWLALGLSDNRLTAGLVDGRDLVPGAWAGAEARVARIHFLATHERVDEAAAQAGRLEGMAQAQAARAHYAVANARLRAALALLERGRIDPALPLVRLAKDGYRRALVADPGFWDAKHNLDVAMRLVRDFPAVAVDPDEEPAATPKRLWTDLPGLPRGLP